MGKFRATFSLSYPGKTGGCQEVGFQCRFRQGQAFAVFAQICSSALGRAILTKPALSQRSGFLKRDEPECGQLTRALVTC